MKISAYTTTFNCIDMDYPFDLCIKSLLKLCDEVCVADGGSTDGTLEMIAEKFPEVKVEVFPVDMNHDRWAIQADGILKNNARSMCTGDILWHADNDEILDERSIKSAKELCQKMYEDGCHGVIKVPFYEFWGSLDLVRGDIFDRPAVSLAKNNFSIGVPNYAKELDDNDNIYCRPFDSDSCQYINVNGSIVPLLTLTNSEIVVWHLSWLDFKRKIMHYKKFWNKFHKSMYNLDIEDTAENNVMFDKPWSEVDNQDILKMSEKFKKMGPRSFHHKQNNWNGLTFNLEKSQVPLEIKNWAKKRDI